MSSPKENYYFRKVINSLMGEDTELVAEYLFENPDVVDEQIAKDLDLNIKIVRNSLYKLHENSLTGFRREHNSETGYFIYYWNIDTSKIKLFINKRRNKVVDVLKYRI